MTVVEYDEVFMEIEMLFSVDIDFSSKIHLLFDFYDCFFIDTMKKAFYQKRFLTISKKIHFYGEQKTNDNFISACSLAP